MFKLWLFSERFFMHSTVSPMVKCSTGDFTTDVGLNNYPSMMYVVSLLTTQLRLSLDLCMRVIFPAQERHCSDSAELNMHE